MLHQRTAVPPIARLTDNKHGLEFPLSKYGQAFVDVAPKAQGPLLDVGAAWGVCTIPALQAGAHVIANDISQTELTALQQTVPESLRSRLTLLPGRFPDEIDLEPESLDAIETSHVLHFLDGPTLELGCRKLFQWLKPGGSVFAVCFTPWHQFMKAFIPIYEERIRQNEKWPGFVSDSTPYVLKPDVLPTQVHLLDDRVLRRVFEEAGFLVRSCEVFPCPENLEPREFFHLDGREWVGLTAVKPD